jgi:hypothetical protein
MGDAALRPYCYEALRPYGPEPRSPCYELDRGFESGDDDALVPGGWGSS